MARPFHLFFCLSLLASFIPNGDLAAQVAADAASDLFVAIAPCRILDTTATPQEETDRKVRLGSTRCGRIVPPYATAYSLRISTLSRNAPESLPPGAGPVMDRSKKVPVQANGNLTFPQAANTHMAVDLDGYYVASGTPLNPANLTGTGMVTSEIGSSAPLAPGKAGTNVVHSGSAGDIYLDGSVLPTSGVLISAAQTNPWITAKTGTANASSGFAVVSSVNTEIVRIRGDGAIVTQPNTFFDGRTDFFGSPGSYFGYVPIPSNVIHDVTLVNPRDAENGNQARVTFFNAYTADEVGSPPITKFNARTGGYYSQENVNFHSSIHWHRPNQFHYRATSSVESKDTFWVKAATNESSVTKTRADMYVSGRVGIGTAAPDAALQVEDLTNDADMILGAGDNSGVPNTPTFSLMRKDANDVQRAKYGLRLDSDDGDKFKLLYGTTEGFTNTFLTVMANGNVGIGTALPAYKLHVDGSIFATGVIGAMFQDLAEWVPATTAMTPGTVVVLNPDRSNEVMPSGVEYDLRVAGVVSSQPGVILGTAGESKEMIATTGRVKVKVDASRSPIRIGDLLVSSGNPGLAMKSEPIDLAGIAIHRPGTILGKALEPLQSGQGEILVLLSLQ